MKGYVCIYIYKESANNNGNSEYVLGYERIRNMFWDMRNLTTIMGCTTECFTGVLMGIQTEN